ncbi:MAG: ABC transporter permease subunit [Gemmatimonadaceae bacterium]|nr:ABC transporter permease subunit [Gemmatimonadaceae bacterium]
MSTILKVVRYELQNVVRNRWVIGYALLFLITTELLLRLGGSTPRALLSLLNLVVLLIPLVTIVFGTIYWHGAREFTELLLAQPVPRGALFHGLFAGLVLPLSAAFILGVALPLLPRGGLGTDAAPLLVLMLVAGVALTAVFGALATLIAGLVDDRLRALGLALAVWAVMTLAWDGLILWVTVAFADRPLEQPLLVMTFLNPVDLARVLLILRLDVSAMMGYTGAVFSRVLGGTAGTLFAVAGLAIWALVPGLLALRAFKRRDF